MTAHPLASRPREGTASLPPRPRKPPEGRREAVTVPPRFVLGARLENASVGRLDG